MELIHKNEKNIFLRQWKWKNICVTIEGIKTYHIFKSRGKTNEKIQVTHAAFQYIMIYIEMTHFQGRRNGFCLGGSEYYERGGADRNPRIYFINPQF